MKFIIALTTTIIFCVPAFGDTKLEKKTTKPETKNWVEAAQVLEPRFTYKSEREKARIKERLDKERLESDRRRREELGVPNISRNSKGVEGDLFQMLEKLNRERPEKPTRGNRSNQGGNK